MAKYRINFKNGSTKEVESGHDLPNIYKCSDMRCDECKISKMECYEIFGCRPPYCTVESVTLTREAEYSLTLDDLGAGKQYQSSSGNTVYVNNSALLYSCDGKPFPAIPRMRFKLIPKLVEQTYKATEDQHKKIAAILEEK